MRYIISRPEKNLTQTIIKLIYLAFHDARERLREPYSKRRRKEREHESQISIMKATTSCYTMGSPKPAY